jgi:AAA+ superfamily predicted ATPase
MMALSVAKKAKKGQIEIENREGIFTESVGDSQRKRRRRRRRRSFAPLVVAYAVLDVQGLRKAGARITNTVC